MISQKAEIIKRNSGLVLEYIFLYTAVRVCYLSSCQAPVKRLAMLLAQKLVSQITDTMIFMRI